MLTVIESKHCCEAVTMTVCHYHQKTTRCPNQTSIGIHFYKPVDAVDSFVKSADASTTLGVKRQNGIFNRHRLFSPCRGIHPVEQTASPARAVSEIEELAHQQYANTSSRRRTMMVSP